LFVVNETTAAEALDVLGILVSQRATAEQSDQQALL
jgi:hypothetical protein